MSSSLKNWAFVNTIFLFCVCVLFYSLSIRLLSLSLCGISFCICLSEWIFISVPFISILYAIRLDLDRYICIRIEFISFYFFLSVPKLLYRANKKGKENKTRHFIQDINIYSFFFFFFYIIVSLSVLVYFFFILFILISFSFPVHSFSPKTQCVCGCPSLCVFF